jgi:hypothetical protein
MERLWREKQSCDVDERLRLSQVVSTTTRGEKRNEEGSDDGRQRVAIKKELGLIYKREHWWV